MIDISAPKMDVLPERRKRTRLGGVDCKDITIGLQTITPILGGGTKARELDSVDVIRVPTIRGHLRFWWRALYGYRYENNFQALYQRERELWGGADTDGAIKSSVEIMVDNCQPLKATDKETGDLRMQDVISYALWPARSQDHGAVPEAHRLKAGFTFDLQIVFSKSSTEIEDELRNVLRAWILFGGYGSRTRRGVGSITVKQDIRKEWLPAAATRESLISLFKGVDIFAPVTGLVSSDMPIVQAGTFIIGQKCNEATAAWKAALGWLRDFRQGTQGGLGNRARDPDPNPAGNRPSVSNWPEADKIRRLSTPKKGTTWAHPPRYNDDPAWPRASLGLPIIGKYQDKNRHQIRWTDLSPPKDEPKDFELRWSPNIRNNDDDNSSGSRLASPLIVKALPLADDHFVPCALWLNRAYPDGTVVLGRNVGGTYTPVPGSNAPFDKIAGTHDTLLFNPLVGKVSVQEAFVNWLVTRPGCTQVVP